MIDDVKAEAEGKMKKTIDAFKRDLQSIRTGRAAPALVEPLKVEYYGEATPLMQLATISSPEARMLLIKPYDASSLKAIEKAILSSELGLTPNNDGKVIRLVLPPLTEERRRELTKVVHRRAEETHVAIRNVRRDANEHLKKLLKEHDVSEDDEKHALAEVQRLTDQHIEEINAALKKKEVDIMEV